MESPFSAFGVSIVWFAISFYAFKVESQPEQVLDDPSPPGSAISPPPPPLPPPPRTPRSPSPPPLTPRAPSPPLPYTWRPPPDPRSQRGKNETTISSPPPSGRPPHPYSNHHRKQRAPPPPAKKNINTGKKIGLFFVGVAAILQIGVVGFLVYKRHRLLRMNDRYETGA